MTEAAFSRGQTVNFHDRLTDITEPVVIDEVLDDRGTWRTTDFRYAIRYQNSDTVFVVGPDRLSAVSA